MQIDMDLLKKMEGKDMGGIPNAVCNVSIQCSATEQEPEVVDSAFTMDAEVAFCITKEWAVVDLCFEDHLSYSLFQVVQTCKRYTEAVRTEAERGEELPALVLSMAPLGEYEQFVIGRNGFWSLMARELEDYCDTIRFIFPREQFGIFELEEETVERMIEDAEKEVG